MDPENNNLHVSQNLARGVFFALFVGLCFFLFAFTYTFAATEASNTAALVLDGSGDYVEISDGSQAGLTLGSSFWILAVIKPTDLSTTFAIADKRDGTGNQRSYTLYWDTDNTLNLSLSGNGTSFETESVSWTPTATQEYFVGVKKNGTSVSFWVNGVQQGSTQTTAIGAPFDNTVPFRIGAGGSDVGTAWDFTGDIDSVMVGSGVVDDAIFANVYADPCTVDDATLVSWWQFNGDVVDAFGTNDLSAVGGAVTTGDPMYTCSGGGGGGGTATTTTSSGDTATSTAYIAGSTLLFHTILIFFLFFWSVVGVLYLLWIR